MELYLGLNFNSFLNHGDLNVTSFFFFFLKGSTFGQAGLKNKNYKLHNYRLLNDN